MKKLLLINPVRQRSGFLLSRFSTFPPLSLSYVGAVTPSNWEVKIADENFGEFKFEEADLVGITAFTTNITRAYEIAHMYRERNIKSIIGGIHASMLPDEALKYVDSVVVGEVEGIWEKVIDDFENNHLEKKYFGPRVDLNEFKILPRRDLLNPDYFFHTVQTSRGCPFNCNFCSVSRYLGKEFRQRRVEDVLQELSEIKSKFIFFADDNLIGHGPASKARALELFEGMINQRLGKKWWMQTSINAGTDEQVLEMAARAGCMFAFIGFESICKETLKDMKKGVNIKIGVTNYKNIIDTFHKYGIAVYSGFIIGNDYESPVYYKQLADFIVHSGIDFTSITILTPLPGTELMEHLQKEGRIMYKDFPKDWDKYRFSYMVYEPKKVRTDTVYIGNNYIKNKLYSFPNYQYRILKSLFILRNGTNFIATYKFNKSLKKGWESSHYYNDYPMNFSVPIT